MKVSTIENLAPSDIANVEVLKDAASAAIYGTEGANGVVIITTKQGKVGDIVVVTTLNLLRNQLGPKWN
jgi:TonB-dependent SusC/RagA subfamily outer membrane receptor